jgi:hypothetical protein
MKLRVGVAKIEEIEATLAAKNTVEGTRKSNQPRSKDDKSHYNIDKLFPYARSRRRGGTAWIAKMVNGEG